MTLRNLYRKSYIYEYAIIKEMMERNKNISVDAGSRGYITGITSYECVPLDEQVLCDDIAGRIAEYLLKKEPSLIDRPIIAEIVDNAPYERNGDKRTLIFIDETGKEIGILVKNYSHSMRQIRAMRPQSMMKAMYHIETEETELDAEFDRQTMTYEDIQQNKEAVYKRYLSYAQRMNYYAFKLVPDAPRRLIQSLLGPTDYYCVDVADKKKTVQITAFNMNGTLNAVNVPYPKELIQIQSGNYSTSAFKNNMLTIIFDGGWMVTMRLHIGASLRFDRPVALKYDISLKGLPYQIENELICL